MRISNRRVRGRGLAAIAAGLVVIACGAPPAPVRTVAPTVRPTPTVAPTRLPDDGASVDALFRGLTSLGLGIVANNADTPPQADRVKRINATYAGWPLTLTEFTTVQTLARATRWKARRLAQGEAPVALAGLNLLVEWGPTTGARPQRPDGARLEALDRLVDALDVLIGPLRVRASIEVAVPTPTPEPTPTPTPSPTPTSSPPPTPTPTPRPTATEAPA
jgi:hypothetical protein